MELRIFTSQKEFEQRKAEVLRLVKEGAIAGLILRSGRVAPSDGELDTFIRVNIHEQHFNDFPVYNADILINWRGQIFSFDRAQFLTLNPEIGIDDFDTSWIDKELDRAARCLELIEGHPIVYRFEKSRFQLIIREYRQFLELRRDKLTKVLSISKSSPNKLSQRGVFTAHLLLGGEYLITSENVNDWCRFYGWKNSPSMLKHLETANNFVRTYKAYLKGSRSVFNQIDLPLTRKVKSALDYFIEIEGTVEARALRAKIEEIIEYISE